MATGSDNPPLVAIVGQTASGKSRLAMRLAVQLHGEIIAADSRTVYRGMDIGTAKPSIEDQKDVPHHLVDVVNPDTKFSVADFKHLATKTISEITARNKVPFLVGGAGLYIDAVLYDFTFRPPALASVRQQLESLSVDALQQIILQRQLPMPTNRQNPRHLIRTIETNGSIPRRQPLRSNTLVLGMAIDDDTLKANIEARVDVMLSDGLVGEVRAMAEAYGWDAPGLQSPGYKEFRSYLEGSQTLEQARAKCIHNHWQLARRQRTWFKRNKSIHWVCKTEEAVDLVISFLNK